MACFRLDSFSTIFYFHTSRKKGREESQKGRDAYSDLACGTERSGRLGGMLVADSVWSHFMFEIKRDHYSVKQECLLWNLN